MATQTTKQDSSSAPPFTVHPSLAAYQVPYKTYLSTVPNNAFTPTLTPRYIAVGALTFDTHDRILLIQRASTDSMPNLWEIPGGACDEEDESILHSVARELEEESGLIATSIGPLVNDGYVFVTSTGNVVCKYSFLVEIAETSNDTRADSGKQEFVDVRLDPSEHQNYVWATEDEVRLERVSDMDIRLTKAEQKQIILDAFQMRQKLKNNLMVEADGGTVTG